MPIIGKLFGEILVHYVSYIDTNERKTSFLKDRWRLNIDQKSKIMALEYLFKKMDNEQTIDGDITDYLINLISELDNKNMKELREKFPAQIKKAWREYGEKLKERSSGNASAIKYYKKVILHQKSEVLG